MVSSTVADATISGTDLSVDTAYTYDSTTRQLTKTSVDGVYNIWYNYDSKQRISEIEVGESNDVFNTYSFDYDTYGNVTSTYVNGSALSTNTYSNARKGLLGTSTYGNGDKVSYSYDSLDRVISKSYNGTVSEKIDYNNKGQVGRVTDNSAGYTTDYYYDLSGRLIQSNVSDGRIAKNTYIYDSSDRITSQDASIGSDTIGYTYVYGKDNLISTVWQGVMKYVYAYDHLNRVTSETITCSGTNVAKNTYTYVNGTSLVCSKQTYTGTSDGFEEYEKYTYYYDTSGNISSIVINDITAYKYEYDSLGQLCREDDYINCKSRQYYYTQNGDLLKVMQGAIGVDVSKMTVLETYEYDSSTNANLLTKFEGESITYDEISNPLSYIDNISMTWKNGRQLDTITVGGETYTYNYNADGLRTSKSNGTTTTNYYYDDAGRLVRMGDGYDAVWFYYNPSGSAMSFKYHDTRYYYIKNAQDDVTAIVDPNGNIVAKYEYDSWGKVLAVTDADGNAKTSSSHIGNINPLRYRSYFFDTESEFYYLNSRYYDTYTRRFINCDGYVSTGTGFIGYNMFAYCGNNPINRADLSGSCYYGLNGQWYHDNWEYIGGYERKPDPKLNFATTSDNRQVYVSKDNNFSVPPNSVKIIDYRQSSKDPDIQIEDSYKIKDAKIRDEIIDIIIDYNNDFPSEPNWERTKTSLIIEWDVHNKLYQVLGDNHTKSVDFNNKDERRYLLLS